MTENDANNGFLGSSEAMRGALNRLRMPVVLMATRLDELADLAEVWKRRREAGKDSPQVRAALIRAAQGIAALVESTDGVINGG